MTPPPPPSMPRARILVVDDEEPLRQTMMVILGREYEVLTAADASEAQRILDEHPVDLVLTDERMPGVRGTDLLARIRERDPDIVRIVLTAYNEPDAMLRAINEGEVLRFLLKPCNPAVLRQEISEALERRRLARENRHLLEELALRNRHLEYTLRELNTARESLVRAEKLALAGRLASGFAHDIRNYLTAVVGLAGLADLGPAGSTVRRLLDQAVHGIHELSSELMMVAEGRPLSYQLERADLAEVVRGFVNDMRGGTIDQTRRLDLEPSVSLPCEVAPRKLWRVLWNLLQNAVDATEEGGRISFRSFVLGSQACVEVEDTGRGMPAEVRARVFEPFFSTRSAGTGLGLEICRIIIEGHGGTIECESAEGVGTTFRIKIPLALS
ncbi:MAG: hybrid sensor histidine kinase/response regulator [bacterium]